MPTVTCSPGWAQLASSPFRGAQDGWGQAGDTPESPHIHGQRSAPPGTPRPPSSGKRRQLPSVVEEKGRHQCHPQPAGMARGGGRGCQPCGRAAGLINATCCHSGCNQPRGLSERRRDPRQRGAEPLAAPRHVWQPVGTAGALLGITRPPPGWGDGARQSSGQGDRGDSAVHSPCVSPRDQGSGVRH